MVISRKSVAHTLRALRHRNYRLFFFGNAISLVGTWLQQVALPWVTFEMTRSKTKLGIVAALGQVSVLVLGPLVGVFVDRTNKLTTVIVTQAAAMLQAFALAALAMSGVLDYWQIVALSAIGGLISAFDVPARQALMFDLIDTKHDLGNAIALNSSLVNIARMVGPAIAGVFIGMAGAGMCFLLNGVSYLAVLISLFMIRLPPSASHHQRKHEDFMHSLNEGVRYVFGFSPMRNLILIVGLASFTAMAFNVLMPPYVAETIGGTAAERAHDFGMLMAASGFGALIGGIHLAARPSVRGLGKLIPLGGVTGGVCMMIFAFTHNLWVACILRLIASIGALSLMASANTILQTIVEDRQRGRLMSFYTMAFIGMAAVGSFVGGRLADLIGSLNVILLMGGITVIFSLVFAARLPHMRQLVVPIYDKLGIPPVAGHK